MIVTHIQQIPNFKVTTWQKQVNAMRISIKLHQDKNPVIYYEYTKFAFLWWILYLLERGLLQLPTIKFTHPQQPPLQHSGPRPWQLFLELCPDSSVRLVVQLLLQVYFLYKRLPSLNLSFTFNVSFAYTIVSFSLSHGNPLLETNSWFCLLYIYITDYLWYGVEEINCGFPTKNQ